MSFANLQWLFPVVVVLHNMEKAIWFPGWSKRTGFWRTPVSPGALRFAAAVMTALGRVAKLICDSSMLIRSSAEVALAEDNASRGARVMPTAAVS
jgi:hypothetical protein